MGVYQNLMGQLSDNNVLFNVEEQPIFTQSGLHIEGKKAIINKSNNNTIGIVSENYKVVPNEEIFDSFCKSIEQSNVNVEGAEINVSFAKYGARTLVDFIFPNEEVTVPGDTSTTALSITALNSFDGSTRYLTKAGGFRMKCLNGQLLGNIVGSYSSTHSHNLDVQKGADQIIHMLQKFRGAEEYWGSMMKTSVSQMTAINVITEFFNKEDMEDPFKNKNVAVVYDLWKSYSREMGTNAYALYNALTDYISHKESKSGASARLNNERKLTKMLNEQTLFSEATFMEAA